MKEEISTQRLTRASHPVPRERRIYRQGVPCRSKRNQSSIFVDPGDQECQGDGANTQIVEEVEHKNECKSEDVTIATNRTSPQNYDNDAQQEPSHAFFAKRSGILRGLAGENDNLGGTTFWINPRG